MREKIPYAQRLNQDQNRNSRTTRLQNISAKKRWKALKRPKNAIQTEVELLQNVGKSRQAEPPVELLRGKAAADREIRQQELREKQEQESQQQMMTAVILQ